MAEQRYRAVLAVNAEGHDVTAVAQQWGVSRQTVHAWLARYEAGGLEGLADRSHRPRSCPHQMVAAVEAVVLELRRQHPGWGPRRLVVELARRGVVPAPSESGVYRAGLIEAGGRRRRAEHWRRWERAAPMELWQMDVVGGIGLTDGSSVKALTGLDDHSRFCVSAALMPAERTRAVCDRLVAALGRHGIPQQILTDNGKVFTGRFAHPPVEVLFDRICRENGIEHLLTAPRSPTTTGKIERFHRSLRAECLTGQVFSSLGTAQAAVDEWVEFYNTVRPHQGLDMATPADRFAERPSTPAPVVPEPIERTGDDWVSRRVASNGVVCVAWQQVSVGKHHAGARCDVHVGDHLLQLWIGSQLCKTVTRTSTGEVRKKRASIPGGRVKQQPKTIRQGSADA